MGTCLIAYGDHEEPSLKASCTFAAGVQLALASCERLDGLPKWVRETRLALDRFLCVLTGEVKASWKASLAVEGIDNLVSKVEAEKLTLPSALEKSFRVVKHGHWVGDINVLQTEPSAETLLANVKLMLTIDSLEIEEIRYFFPNVPDEIRVFRNKVTDLVEADLKKIKDLVVEGQKCLAPYRPGQIEQHLSRRSRSDTRLWMV